MSVDQDRIKAAVAEIIEAIGEDPDSEGLKGTPDRVARWWAEFIDRDPGNLTTAFDAVESDQMVVVSGIRVWSICEHHLLPFWCDVAIGYIPICKILGLSKFARIAHAIASYPQVQERLTAQIADDVEHFASTGDVAVLVKGEHLCMSMRGIRTPATMTTSVLRGAFREDPAARAEFMALVK